MKRLSSVLAISLVLLTVLSGCTSTATFDQQITSVSPAEAAGIVEENVGNNGFVLLDLRTPEEYAAGKIEGAVNIDFYDADFRQQLDALDRDTHYLVYCNSGNRSGQSLPIFEDLGFREVDNVATGITGWYDSGYPVVP
jgi:rhodanese-related sulfurtransferase